MLLVAAIFDKRGLDRLDVLEHFVADLLREPFQMDFGVGSRSILALRCDRLAESLECLTIG
jgi:hypothetical protein